MADVFLKNNSARGDSDRAQRIAFLVSIAGALLNAVLFTMYAFNDGISPLLIINAAFYMLPLGLIAYASYNSWHFRTALDAGVGIIYFYMWATTFFDAISGHPSVLSYPTLLFIPFLMILVSRYQLLIGYAFVQSALVYLYGEMFLAQAFGYDGLSVDTSMLPLLLAVCSGLCLLVLAIVAYSRQKTDKRLLSLVQETERLAARDPLTGLKNRRAFMDDVEQLWQSKAPFTVVFIDLDRFKPLNDEYGHAIGDKTLQAIAKRLERAPAANTTARLGGDEFAIIVDQQPSDRSLHETIKDIHQSIVSDIELNVGILSVGASLGYASAPFDGISVSELLHAADTAMLRSKGSGGGVARYDPKQDISSFASAAVEDLFRAALKAKRLKPALQPIIESRTGDVIGHELLARWPNSGLTHDPNPNQFIPIAEKLGLLNALLWHTMDVALPFVNERGGFLAINVSPSQLSSSTFLDDLKSVLARNEFAPDRLEIEVTEHVAFRNLEDNIRILEQARQLGCRIVLDDFGSGYSSLSLLEELPLDKVKLDKSLQGTANKRGVLQATINLAKGLRFTCCVEGVETADAASFAAARGCDQMQGYWFGHPELIDPPSSGLRLVS
ncbi:MAG: EAL domain-containing protein [Pseudomonadota bacterium]